MKMKLILLLIFISAQNLFALELHLSKRGELLINDDFTKIRGKKPLVPISDTWTTKAGLGQWEHKDSVYRSTWEPGVGHTPVMSYQGKGKNLIIECIFRYGEMDQSIDWHTQCFRIALDNRELYTGHILSAWANPNNDFIETGFLLQHIHKNRDKSIVSDLLLDRQDLNIQIGRWTKVLLEVVDDEVLFQMEGHHLAYAKLDKLNVAKTNISLTLGKTWHELQSFKVWEALPNPEWSEIKNEVLSMRQTFEPQTHNYLKPSKK